MAALLPSGFDTFAVAVSFFTVIGASSSSKVWVGESSIESDDVALGDEVEAGGGGGNGGGGNGRDGCG